jgi:hypothetical protein
LKYGSSLLIEITVHITVIFPDTANLLTGLKKSGGIFKDGNFLPPSRYWTQEFIESLPENNFWNKFCNNILGIASD